MSLAHYGPSSRRSVDDAERPFWISYADLMTALMILFLVIMVAALSSITKKAEQINLDSQKISKVITDRDEPNPLKVTDAEKRVQEIASICKYLSDKVAGSGQPVFVDCKLNRINFGEAGRFATDDYKLDAKGDLLQNTAMRVSESEQTTSAIQRDIAIVLDSIFFCHIFKCFECIKLFGARQQHESFFRDG